MPYVILKFKVPEEKEELELAQNGGGYFSALHDMSRYIRELRKYRESPTVDVEELHEKFYSIIADNDIEL